MLRVGTLTAGLWVAVATLTGCTKPSAPPAEPAPSWSSAVHAGIAAGEYAPKATGDGYRVTNRAQDLRGTFAAQGLAVTTRAGAGEVTLALRAWGREPTMVQVEPTPPAEGPCLAGGAVDAFSQCLRRVDYPRPGLTEWWENRPAGLEQGFTVTAPPAGEGALVFELAVSGARVEVDGAEARLVREAGAALRYDKLAAWDERGQALPAWMEEVKGGLRIAVDDAGAEGVVTVDPLLTTVGSMLEADQEHAAFGYSVASAGDVNGDGFGDVVVGAPSYDSGLAHGGAAFVYHGSAAGLGTSAAWTAASDQDSALFGFSVASAGDVNGDGYSDVVVGADSYDHGETDEGRVFVYLGGVSGLATGAAWTAESDQAGASLGASVASAGDVNGDGFSDLVAGARRYNNGATVVSAAFVYLGRENGLEASATWMAELVQGGPGILPSVASAGDVNGDGFGDVVLGAPRYSNGTTGEGGAFVYHGSVNGLEPDPAWTAESNQSSAYFGTSVASAGDVNGDGYGDVVVGAPNYDNGETDEGRAFVYLGSMNGLSLTADWTVESDRLGGNYAGSVASAGDVNGDGYGDVVVGAYSQNNDEGVASVYFGGGAGLASVAAWTVEQDQADAVFGGSVASAGDVNGDGFGDVVVGANDYDHGSLDEGAAFVYLGSGSGLGTSEAWRTESESESDRNVDFGVSVASAGDVNGDGYGDVVVGAPNNGDSDEGAAFMYLGSADGLSPSAAWAVESDQGSAHFGDSVASAGDVNGDGYGDVVVGAYYLDGETYQSKAFLYLGNASGLEPHANWTVEFDQAGAVVGSVVASAGDVNGDGYDDVVVGAMGYGNGEPDEGKVFVFLGNASGLAPTAAWTAESDQAEASFGNSVASAGDVNGDGYGDVVVGAYRYGSRNEGAAFIYLGSASGLATEPSWFIEGLQTGIYLGSSVASAGDVNGDGYGDVVVGAEGYRNGSSSEGAAFVYVGSASGLTAHFAWTVESNQAAALMGKSVASAGDVNGDGYGDVVVGASRYDGGSLDEGAAFVYLGSASGLATRETWMAESDQAAAGFGCSVASAGDVNGDGYGDVVVGASDYGAATGGAAFLYLGNTNDGTTPLSRAGQARQSGITTPIPPGLVSTSPHTFDVSMPAARTSWGFGLVKLQVEVKPLGQAFDGTDLVTSSMFHPTGLTGAAIQEAIPGLTGSTGYHWRARVLASPAEGRPQGWGPWWYGGRSGDAVGGHVFTAGSVLYADTDGDGYGNGDGVVTTRAPALPGFVPDATDCDDADAGRHPGAIEVCDPADNDEDCDGVADDASAVGASAWHRDADLDGYGAGSPVIACEPPAGFTADATDCDDADAQVHPGATEVCDPADTDEDCDGLADDASAAGLSTFYLDADGDSYGGTTPGTFCDRPPGYVAGSTDCDDNNHRVSPAAIELCDPLNTDEDCDGLADDADPTAIGAATWYEDADGDGHGGSTQGAFCDLPVGYAATFTDCDDTDPAWHPGAPERDCADPSDYNCDGFTGRGDGDGDGFDACEDCDDGDVAIHPGATEVCDPADRDEDCDGLADDASALGLSTYYLDADRDGYGASSGTFCDPPPGYVERAGDCDDEAAGVHPGAAEVCDPADRDEDCDGLADDASALGPSTFYVDADGDGYGGDSPAELCELQPGYAANSDDCDDLAAATYPGAVEVCDPSQRDEDCDGRVDDGDASVTGQSTFYPDNDNDGYGGGASVVSCVRPNRYVARAGDCNDNAAVMYPGATEVCDPQDLDEDCDGLADDADPSASALSTWYVDADGDGYGGDLTGRFCDLPEGYAASSDDCDDSDALINPNPITTEVCDPLNVDEDCDGRANDASAVGAVMYYADADGDGYGGDSSDAFCDLPAGYAASSTDCDDSVATVHPGATEVCDPANVDENCDGQADDAAAAGQITFYVDADGDGYGGAGSGTFCDLPSGYAASFTDCDDNAATVHPDATEVCDPANVDEDCDGQADDAAAAGQLTFYVDADGDGYGGDSPGTFCDLPAGYAASSTDCDDNAATVHPGAAEVCDPLNTDEDCDGQADDSSASGQVTYYVDGDGDGYGGSVSGMFCDLPSGYAMDATDCDDADAAYHPNAPEDDCDDPADYNCDGSTGAVDADDDGFDACEDCDDANSAVHPDAQEVCDAMNVDEDCDGSADDDDVDDDAEPIGRSTFYQDRDGDGYGGVAPAMFCDLPSDYFTDSEDCDDDNGEVSPEAPEIYNNDVDEDCSGVAEECREDIDEDGFGGVMVTVSAGRCESDGALITEPGQGDCNDANPTIHPGAKDVASDGIDQDCDGEGTGCSCANGGTPGFAGLVLLVMWRGRRRQG
jgi:hypothetical protein